MKHHRTLMMGSCVLLIGAIAAVAEIAGGGLDLSWNTVDGGGGTSAGGGPSGFELSGTIGQPDATSVAMTGGGAGGFELKGGFWPGAGPQPKINPCPADIAPLSNPDGIVNVLDLLAVIGGWGSCPDDPAPCPADIAPTPTPDGTVNVLDLLAVISGWGSCTS